MEKATTVEDGGPRRAHARNVVAWQSTERSTRGAALGACCGGVLVGELMGWRKGGTGRARSSGIAPEPFQPTWATFGS